MGTLTLISGANNSGKSSYAEHLASKTAENRIYIATMIPRTEENERRIEKHCRQREQYHFQTLERPYQVGDAPVLPECVVLLEDVSNLLANVMFERQVGPEQVCADIAALQERCGALIAVTISDLKESDYSGETAEYVRCLNRLNGMLWARADRVIEMQEQQAVDRKGGEYDAD